MALVAAGGLVIVGLAPVAEAGVAASGSPHLAGERLLSASGLSAASASAPASAPPSEATIYFMQVAPRITEVWIDGVDAGALPAPSAQGFNGFEAPVPAIATSIQIFPKGGGPKNGTPLASANPTLAAGRDYLIAAYADSTGTDQVSVFPFDSTSPTPIGQEKIVFRNLADIPPVDIYVNGNLVASSLADTPADQPADETLVNPGMVSLMVTAAGNRSDVLARASYPSYPSFVGNFDVTGAPASGSTASTLFIGGFVFPLPTGYVEATSNGGVYTEGSTTFHGSLAGTHLAAPIVATSIYGKGYTLVSADGGVFAFGEAPYYGSLPGLHVRVNDIVGIAFTQDGNGYWLFGADGSVYSFGDATFFGSLGGKALTAPVVGMTPNYYYGGGYLLVDAAGDVFTFGNAQNEGSLAGKHLAAPIVGIKPTSDGLGYWMVSADGGVFAFGSAEYLGSAAGAVQGTRIVGMETSDDNQGYRLVAANGDVFDFGNAAFEGVPGPALNGPVVASDSP